MVRTTGSIASGGVMWQVEGELVGQFRVAGNS